MSWLLDGTSLLISASVEEELPRRCRRRSGQTACGSIFNAPLSERMLHTQVHPLLSSAEVVEQLRHQPPAAAVTPDSVMTKLQHLHRKRQNSIDSARRNQRPPDDFDERPGELPK